MTIPQQIKALLYARANVLEKDWRSVQAQIDVLKGELSVEDVYERYSVEAEVKSAVVAAKWLKGSRGGNLAIYWKGKR